MKRQQVLLVALVVLLAVNVTTTLTLAQGPTGTGQASAPLASAGTAFTYQGQLKNGGNVVNATCDLQFGLWDALTLGAQIGVTQTKSSVSVSNGLFTTQLDFGANVFNGDARWLADAVRCPAASGSYTPLEPRQPLTAAPYALNAGNANLLDGQGSSAFVTVSGTQTISGVKTFSGGVKFPDGTTQTTAFYQRALPGPGVAATVDSAGGVGEYSSITIGADGLGLISYYDATNGDLKVLHCGNAACNGGNITTTMDSAGYVGFYTSVTIGADGLGLISYYDSTNGNLKVLHCGNAACNGGNISTTMDSAGDVGQHSSITIGADWLGLISYYDATNGDLKVLHCGNAACSGGNISTTVDSGGDVGYNTSITIGADGLGLISYLDPINGDLKVLHCGNAACNGGNISTTVDSAGTVGGYDSITIGADGLGLISYYGATGPFSGVLKVLHCGNAACSSGNTVTTVNSAGDVGIYTSVTIGADGLGLVSYYDYTIHGLNTLHCGNAACNGGNTETNVDSMGGVGAYASITIGADGLGLISYYDSTNGDLKVFHCSNLTCTPYARVGR